MKARLFTAFVSVVSLPLLASPVLGGGWPAAAQSPPAALAAPVLGEAEGPAPVSDRAHVSAALHSAPLMFIENVGQFDQRARFQVHGGHATLYLAEDGLWVRVAKDVNLKLSFAGANPHPRLEPFNRLDTRVSYFVGSDPAKWRADVPVWGGVRYADLYPGADLEVTGDGGRWAWQLACRSNCQPFGFAQGRFALQDVRLRVDGADALALDGDVLRLTTARGEYTLPLLQVVGAADTNLASPSITGDQVALPFASVTPNPQPAITVPQSGASDLLYSTFLGGSRSDGGSAVAVDEAGSVYVTGYTGSSDFPTTAGAFDSGYDNDNDAFVVKVNAAGTGLAYATFLGGSNGELGWAIAVDGAGSAYVAGSTGSFDFPTTAGAFDTSYNGNDDAFVVKLNAAGTGLVYATFLGGSGLEWGRAIAVDEAGSTYVTGDTASSDFPTTAGAFDTSYNGNDDAFVVKLNAAGTGLAYATFLGGVIGSDRGDAVAVDGAGNACVTGLTVSPDFPTTAGAFDRSLDGYMDAFVVKVDADGTGLTYATFLGGSDWDWGRAVAVDEAGSVYVTGSTESPDFPTTAGAFDMSLDGNQDAFVVKVNAGGTWLVYATFLGGSSDYDYGYAIAADGAGSAYVTGQTDSSDFPTTEGAFDTSHDGSEDAFVVKMSGGGTGLAYATFLGGSKDDYANAIAVDGAGSAYVVGVTSSSDFPTTTGAFDTSHNGNDDAFVAKIRTGEVMPTPSPPLGPINGGFEEGFYLLKGESIANGWAAYSVWGQPTFAGERFTVHSGRWAYKISGYARFTAGLAQVMPVQPGRTYRVTAYYQLYPPGDGQAFLGVQDGTSATQWVGDSWPGVWRPLSQVITVTSDRLTITLQGHNGVGLNTNVYFDDAMVTELGQP